jgi:hypothetical protein
MLRATGAHARDALVVAQDQHRAVLDAIGRREAARAEAVMQRARPPGPCATCARRCRTSSACNICPAHG